MIRLEWKQAVIITNVKKSRVSKSRTTEINRRSVGRPRRDSGSADTRQVILAAAEDVLITVGYANFTTRKVAEAAGIAIGNLTYHFPNKVTLTESLIDYVLSRYLEHIRASLVSRTESESGEHPLSALLRWTMADAVTPHIGRLCRELWAMACHQKFAARAMDEFYRRMIRAAVEVAQAACPAMKEREALHLTYFMALLSEGAVVLFGTLPEASRLLPGVTELAVQAIEHLSGGMNATHALARRAPRAKESRAQNRPTRTRSNAT
jgi:AcrR family transcriptional regulator